MHLLQVLSQERMVKMMNKKGLTISLIIETESANYGDGVGNTSTLKKMTRGDDTKYTYISRQALRYSIVRALEWDNTPVDAKGKGAQTVVQFLPEATIKDYPEIDLFGYMKTESEKGAATRNAVVRLSNAISLEEYKDDTDFLTNMGLAKRNGNDFNNSIVKSEIHHTYYGYTIAIDLDLVGIDGEIEIDNKEKANRVNKLLETVEFLYRDIRGRRENLNPIFVIGGIYERKNPYFEHRLQLESNNLKIETIEELLENKDVKENTKVGILKGKISNEQEIIEKFNASSISKMFEDLKNEVNEYYNESN